ncbi:protein of unknown function [Bartonella clarridgeiae 73]|uniref:Uncharacterized protein n=1 Tax=Bartonella clarridgeiae (strain CCUG 45776 / CIP 104772 / 73) TaxID=696125 RepID=E6YIL1_BARC7|nr:MAG: hypothetical protein PG977_000129 [Bartonella clarridgeiae]CBI76699.1 protein of unknown function [Bartonella clarridgeiae 73]
MSRLGLAIGLASWISNDTLGIFTRQHFEKTSFDLSGLHVNPNAMTGIASITLSESGEDTIIVAGRSNMAIKLEDIKKSNLLF